MNLTGILNPQMNLTVGGLANQSKKAPISGDYSAQNSPPLHSNNNHDSKITGTNKHNSGVHALEGGLLPPNLAKTVGQDN